MGQGKGSLTGMKLLAQVEDDLQPVYRVTQGVSQNNSGEIDQNSIRSGLGSAFRREFAPSLRERYQLLSRSQAVQAMHFPKDLAEYKQALRRVKFEELLFSSYSSSAKRRKSRSQPREFPWPGIQKN